MTDNPLEHRVATLEDRVDGHDDDVSVLMARTAELRATLVPMQADIADLKEAGIRSDAARERQTEILTGKMDEVKTHALKTVPTWASTLITILAMLLAGFVTAYYTR